MSGAHFRSDRSNGNWLVVERGLEKFMDIKHLMDSFQQEGFDLRYLEKGFPPVGDSLEDRAMPANYWHLAEELKQRSLNNIVVISTNRMVGFNGKRTALPENVKWIIREGILEEFPIYAVRTSSDYVSIRKGITSTLTTHFESKSAEVIPGQLNMISGEDSVRIISPDTIKVEILFDEAFTYDKLILSASLTAIRKFIPSQVIVISNPVSAWDPLSKAGWIFWLSDKPVPETVNHRMITIQKKNQEDILVQAGPIHWILTEKIHEEVAIQKNLSLQLALLLLENEEYEIKRVQRDKRSLPEMMTWSSNKTPATHTKKAASLTDDPLQQYLIFFIILTLMIERIVANMRYQ
jgi:hypothetical protein